MTARYCTCTIIIFAAPCRPSPAHLASAYSSQYPPAPVIRRSMPLHARLHNQLTSYKAPYKDPYYSPYYTASSSSNLLYPPPALPRQHTRQDQKSGILPSVVADVGQKQRLLPTEDFQSKFRPRRVWKLHRLANPPPKVACSQAIPLFPAARRPSTLRSAALVAVCSDS